MEDKRKANQAIEQARVRAMQSLERVLNLLTEENKAEEASSTNG